MKTFKIHSSHLFTLGYAYNLKPPVLREIRNCLLKEKYQGISMNINKYKCEIVTLSFDKSN
jgi:hypothetical protein